MRCKRREHMIRPLIADLLSESERVVEGRVQRLTPTGRWVQDDGVSTGLAFTAGVMAYYPGPWCGCVDRRRCIADMAMRHVSSHYSYGCANGCEVIRYVKNISR